MYAGMGELHLDIVKSRVKREYGIDIALGKAVDEKVFSFS